MRWARKSYRERNEVGKGMRGARLVVGGGRAEGFPVLRAGDVSLNIARSATPHVIGDIAAAPFRSGAFVALYFERVPFTAFTGRQVAAIREAARLLQPGGRVVIETGIAASVPEIRSSLQDAGFANIRVSRTGLLTIRARLGRR